MSFFYHNCKECGTKINKLQSWWNVYLLKTGVNLKCPQCNTEYKTNRIIGFIGYFYTWSGVSILLLLISTSYLWDIFEKLFNIKIGGEMWIYTFLILSIIELIIMGILPLHKIKNKEQGE